MDFNAVFEDWVSTTALDITELTNQQRADLETAMVAIGTAQVNLASGDWTTERARNHTANARAILTDIGLVKGWEARNAAREFATTLWTGAVRTGMAAIFGV